MKTALFTREKKLPTGSCKNCLEGLIEVACGNVENRWNARFYWAYRVLPPDETLWRHGCDRFGGATRYQVVNSTDGVRWLPG